MLGFVVPFPPLTCTEQLGGGGRQNYNSQRQEGRALSPPGEGGRSRWVVPRGQGFSLPIAPPQKSFGFGPGARAGRTSPGRTGSIAWGSAARARGARVGRGRRGLNGPPGTGPQRGRSASLRALGAGAACPLAGEGRPEGGGVRAVRSLLAASRWR